MTGSSRRRLTILLVVVFMTAMLLGPGPGLRLVNPDTNDPDAHYVIWGLPIIYAWGLFWYAVQIAVIVVAYRTIWNDPRPDGDLS